MIKLKNIFFNFPFDFRLDRKFYRTQKIDEINKAIKKKISIAIQNFIPQSTTEKLIKDHKLMFKNLKKIYHSAANK